MRMTRKELYGGGFTIPWHVLREVHFPRFVLKTALDNSRIIHLTR
jgi:hypothetical protein